ncbi:MAG: alpha-ketoglutarate-dependent 2,4-dichlorophenoxyacetate dioxygenase [Alphaproteobacteria bacterium]
MVHANPVTGKPSLFIGSHASHILEMPEAEGRAMLDGLLENATRPNVVYSHQWRNGDVVVWDNRSALHRATAFDATQYRRLMQRTTIVGEAA